MPYMTRKDDASFLLDTRAKTLAEREEEFISCHYFLNILPHTQVTILNPITSFVLALFLYYIYVFHGIPSLAGISFRILSELSLWLL